MSSSSTGNSLETGSKNIHLFIYIMNNTHLYQSNLELIHRYFYSVNLPGGGAGFMLELDGPWGRGLAFWLVLCPLSSLDWADEVFL